MMGDNTTPHSASSYDAQILNTIPYYDFFHHETIKLITAAQVKPRFWLDTGCGTGTLVQKAASSFKDTIFIMTDPSPEIFNITYGGKNEI